MFIAQVRFIRIQSKPSNISVQARMLHSSFIQNHNINQEFILKFTACNLRNSLQVDQVFTEVMYRITYLGVNGCTFKHIFCATRMRQFFFKVSSVLYVYVRKIIDFFIYRIQYRKQYAEITIVTRREASSTFLFLGEMYV